jgi:hypothetical protein
MTLSKPLLGLILGAALGAIDGASALFYPGAEADIVTIVLFSTAKGLLAGWITGLVARRTGSLPIALVTGLVVSALLSYAATLGTKLNGEPVFWPIMLPGMALGLICGFVTARYGRSAAPSPAPA